MTPEDFDKLISDELHRQIPILVRYDSSIDSKIGIFLGFDFLVFVQIVLLGHFVLRLSALELFFYALGLLLILLSIAGGMIAYFWRGMGGPPVGVNVKDMTDAYARGVGGDYEREIQASMLDSASRIRLIVEQKVKLTRAMAIFFSVGISVITGLAFCCIYGMVI